MVDGLGSTATVVFGVFLARGFLEFFIGVGVPGNEGNESDIDLILYYRYKSIIQIGGN